MPGDEEVKSAIGMREVRFSHSGDARAAEFLADAAVAALEAIGIADFPPTRAVDFTGFRGQKPPRGFWKSGFGP